MAAAGVWAGADSLFAAGDAAGAVGLPDQADSARAYASSAAAAIVDAADRLAARSRAEKRFCVLSAMQAVLPDLS